MGIPALFAWLSKTYPDVVTPWKSGKAHLVNGSWVLPDATGKNPEGKFDNLYLDMNGIIHPCCHPDDGEEQPKTEEEMMAKIADYIEHVFSLVRPQNLLYMAVDGVAPRAKMNQQRSRRYRAAQEAEEFQQQLEDKKQELRDKGISIPSQGKGEKFDSNSITPGTPFMQRLGKFLRYFVHERIANDPAWAKITIILSDANSPGEGEHKIMEYIRCHRNSSTYDPNLAHVLYGADADLVMLGLATHEKDITIIREQFQKPRRPPCRICGGRNHSIQKCTGVSEDTVRNSSKVSTLKRFVRIRLDKLRPIIGEMLKIPSKKRRFNDLSRLVDDWVFLCFFVGNDFLPHLPSLSIHEGALEMLCKIYRDVKSRRKGGFLTDRGTLNIDNILKILKALAPREDGIFRNRYENGKAEKNRKKKLRKLQVTKGVHLTSSQSFELANNRDNLASRSLLAFADMNADSSESAAVKKRKVVEAPRTVSAFAVANASTKKNSQPTKEANKQKTEQDEESEPEIDPNMSAFAVAQIKKRKRQEAELRAAKDREGEVKKKKKKSMDDNHNEANEDEEEDDIRLWEEGFKDRYYSKKFKTSVSNAAFREKVAREYVNGLSWVMRYYYEGCQSWKWYYPFHYAPFASDLLDCSHAISLPDFSEPTQPFKPLEQLMAVFPPASRTFLPPKWADLMTDGLSPVIQYYPEDFVTDLNGKKHAWQGVALLPFVDEEKLLASLRPRYKHLTVEEKDRNSTKDSLCISGPTNRLFGTLENVSKPKEIDVKGYCGIIKPLESEPRLEVPYQNSTIFAPIETVANSTYLSHDISDIQNRYVPLKNASSDDESTVTIDNGQTDHVQVDSPHVDPPKTQQPQPKPKCKKVDTRRPEFRGTSNLDGKKKKKKKKRSATQGDV